MPEWKRAPDDDTTYYYMDDEEYILGYVTRQAKGRFRASVRGEKGYTTYTSKARAMQHVVNGLTSQSE